MSRMKQKYNDITPSLREECGIKNVMQTPKLEKIVISVGRGTPRKGFNGRGNYNFGLQEQLMFPEVEFDNIIKTHGMNITIVTSTENDKAYSTPYSLDKDRITFRYK